MNQPVVDTGYDPARIDELAHRTIDALDALVGIRSTDPAASDALRVVRLVRRNLEDLWVPAIREIQRSDVMVSWTSANLSFAAFAGARALRGVLPPHLRRHEPSGAPTSLATLSDEIVIGRLRWTDRLRAVPGDVYERNNGLDELGRELAVRVRRSETFARQLIALSPTTTTIATLLGTASFPPTFVAAVVTEMMGPTGPESTADLDAYARAVSAALDALAAHPAACLDLLLDTAVLFRLASWERLDQHAVTRVVTGGLSTSVDDDPARLGDGYEVLRVLVTIADGPLDRGMSTGMARGVASSLGGFVDTLAPAVFHTGDKPVEVSAGPLRQPVLLGSYDEVAGLLGAVLRDEVAATSVGMVLGAYTHRLVTDLGPNLLASADLVRVASLATLVDVAAAREQAQLVEEADAVEVQRRQIGSVIGLGVSGALVAVGAGPTARSGATLITRVAAERWADVEPQDLPDGSPGQRVFDRATLSIVGLAVADPRVLRAAGKAPLTRPQIAELTRRLAEIESGADAAERDLRLSRLEQHLMDDVPELYDLLDAARTTGSLKPLV